jgi:DNA-binding LacI/PurR family transcriptional regulator/DNA-binding transcriptional regulator YhcF (GntR family)
MTTRPQVDITILSPTTLHVARTLEERIQQGVYKAGQRLPSERMLADEFGVSRPIIRAALDVMEQRSLVLRSARCRPVVSRTATNGIEAIGGDSAVHRTVAPPRPPRLSSTSRRSIAVCMWPGLEDSAASAMVRGIRTALDAEAFRLLLESPHGASWGQIQRSEARFLERIAREGDCDGVILYYLGGEESMLALEEVRDAGIPLVFLDRRPPAGFEADHVGVDNVMAAEEAVRYLIALGHRRIVHLSNTDNASTVEERERGYRRAMSQAEIPVLPEWILRSANEGGHRRGDAGVTGAQSLLRLLAQPDPPTAVFTVNDLEAFYLLEVLKREGVRIPEDLSIIGFDGAERWRPGDPYLSTMYQPFERIGECAVDLLLERTPGEIPRAFRHVLLNASLVAAATTAPPRVAATSVSPA